MTASVRDLKKLIRDIIRQELDARENRSPKMGRCAWCERDFPEDALNWSSGDPACASCHMTVSATPVTK